MFDCLRSFFENMREIMLEFCRDADMGVKGERWGEDAGNSYRNGIVAQERCGP